MAWVYDLIFFYSACSLIFMLKWCWGTDFQALNSLAYSQKYPYKPINYFGPPQIFPTNYPNISHILPNLSLHKYFSYHYQNWATKLYCLYINSNLFILWAKHKKPNKTLLKGRCYMAPLKPVATQHPKVHCYMTLLQSPLLHSNILQNLKLFIKVNIILATIYKKLKYYFGNYSQNPNTTLVTIYKSPILFWQLFTKTQYYFGNFTKSPILFWQLLQRTQYYLATLYKKPNITLATFYQNPKPLG